MYEIVKAPRYSRVVDNVLIVALRRLVDRQEIELWVYTKGPRLVSVFNNQELIGALYIGLTYRFYSYVAWLNPKELAVIIATYRDYVSQRQTESGIKSCLQRFLMRPHLHFGTSIYSYSRTYLPLWPW